MSHKGLVMNVNREQGGVVQRTAGDTMRTNIPSALFLVDGFDGASMRHKEFFMKIKSREQNTKIKIMLGMLSLIEIYGYHGTTIAKIATFSGIEKASLYHYFSSKADILAAVIDMLHAELMSLLDEVLGKRDISDVVGTYIAKYFRFIVYMRLFLDGDEALFYIEHHFEQYRKSLLSVISQLKSLKAQTFVVDYLLTANLSREVDIDRAFSHLNRSPAHGSH